MNIEAMTKWIEALEDPANEKRQIRGAYGDRKGGVCALGLAYEVFGYDPHGWLVSPECQADLTQVLGWDGEGVQPTAVAAEYAHVGYWDVFVHVLNDSERWSFWDIAQALRATHLKENT